MVILVNKISPLLVDVTGTVMQALQRRVTLFGGSQIDRLWLDG